MGILCSPTEPKRLRSLGTTSSIPERHGADFLLVAGKTRIGVQRKQFPGDLLASLDDSRLYGQLPLLRELDQALVVIEGHGRWTEDGELLADKYHRFTKTQMHGLRYSIMFEFGIPTMWVRDMDETVEVLGTLEAWMAKGKHRSLKSRKGPSSGSWGIADRHRAQHVLQGFPGVGPELAGRMVDHFEGVPLTWTHSVEELMAVEGVGKKKAEGMVKALDTVKVEEKK